MNNQRKRPPFPPFRVAWVGQDLKHLYVKDFMSFEEASTFSKTVLEGIILSHRATKGLSHQWEIVPSPNSKLLIRDTQLRRKLMNESGFFNANGATEIGTVTTSELRKSQNVRLIDVFAIAPLLIYAGTRKELNQLLRWSLIGVGIATAYYNGKNYLANAKTTSKEN